MNLNRHHDIVVTDSLKSLYFEHRDTLLLTSGVITCHLSSPAIEAIKSLIASDAELEEQFLGQRISVLQESPATLAHLLENLNTQDDEEAHLSDDSETQIRLKSLLQRAVSLDCSDVHIEFYEQRTQVDFRVDGRIVSGMEDVPERSYGEEMSSVIFNIMAKDADDNFHVGTPNNGRIHCPLTVDGVERDTTWRASYLYTTNGGGKTTLRWLNKNATIPKMEALGWEPNQIQVLREYANSSSGFAIISGQVGSGKTTTLAAILAEMRGSGRKLHTLEDPVEFDLGVPQTTVAPNTSIASLAKVLLRHDVDIELHGELRDHEGAMSATRKAETGQIMFASMHTSSALGNASTLIDQMGIHPSIVAAPNLMKLWMYQTLVRALCPHCKLTFDEAQAAYSTRKKEWDIIKSWARQWTQEEASALRFRHPSGCEHCIEGEKGRTALLEMIVLDDEDREFILNRQYLAWSHHLKEKGFKSIQDHARLKLFRGEIDLLTTAGRVDNLIHQEAKAVYASLW